MSFARSPATPPKQPLGGARNSSRPQSERPDGETKGARPPNCARQQLTAPAQRPVRTERLAASGWPGGGATARARQFAAQLARLFVFRFER